MNEKCSVGSSSELPDLQHHRHSLIAPWSLATIPKHTRSRSQAEDIENRLVRDEKIKINLIYFQLLNDFLWFTSSVCWACFCFLVNGRVELQWSVESFVYVWNWHWSLPEAPNEVTQLLTSLIRFSEWKLRLAQFRKVTWTRAYLSRINWRLIAIPLEFPPFSRAKLEAISHLHFSTKKNSQMCQQTN